MLGGGGGSMRTGVRACVLRIKTKPVNSTCVNHKSDDENIY